MKTLETKREVARLFQKPFNLFPNGFQLLQARRRFLKASVCKWCGSYAKIFDVKSWLCWDCASENWRG